LKKVLKKEENAMKQVTFRLTVLYLLLFLAGVISNGCQKSSTESKSESKDQSELLVGTLSIALVPGGTQTVAVDAKDKNDNRESFEAICEDEQIALVTSTDATFTVTGVSYGSSKILVTTNSGKTKEIPVKIYNPQILETDELLITFSQTFEARYYQTGQFWHPVTSNGFHALGSISLNYSGNPNGKEAVMVVKAKEGSNALAYPESYIKRHQGGWGSCWQPVPPDGYVAMGMVASGSFGSAPPLNDVVCIREDLVIAGAPGDIIWYYKSGSTIVFVSWKIEPPNTGPHDYAYLSPGTFLAEGSLYTGPDDLVPPSVHPVMNVLKVNLPMLAETPYQQYVPTLTGYDPPPDVTVPILARAMLVPCTVVNDPFYASDQPWRINNSPFYVLERQVFYKLKYHNYNQTSVLQHNSYIRTYGVTTTEGEEFWNETGVTVSVEAGVSIGIFTGKVTTTVSTSFGYSTMTSVAELQQDEFESGLDVPPGKAVAIWQRYSRFVLKRQNATSLEPVKAWEFGINSYVTDEYPD
jgi:hypothetical protein